MRVVDESGVRLLQGRAHWSRCGLVQLVADNDVVKLQSTPPPAPEGLGEFTGGFAGLAFDRRCRLLHSRPEQSAFEMVIWGRVGQTGVHDDQPSDWPVTAAGTEVDGHPTGPLPQLPQALASAGDDWLWVADATACCVWVVDLWQQEVARSIALPAPPRDLAACGDTVWVLLEDGSTWQLAPCDAPRASAWSASPGAERLIVAQAPQRAPQAWVLAGAGSAAAELRALHRTQRLAMPWATDLAFESLDAEGLAVLVLAQRPGEHFVRWQVTRSTADRLDDLIAPHYDGRGLERAPDGRFVYWTTLGRARHAAPAKGRYALDGTLFGFALDGEQVQCRWGRLVVEACIPEGCALRVRAFSADEARLGDLVPGAPDADDAPALPLALWERRDALGSPLFRDPSPRALMPAPADGFAWYDAPVPAAPGRFLWLVVEFAGTRSRTPRLRSASAEFPGHALLSQLPRTLWRDEGARDFLYRLLMPIAAMLDEWTWDGAMRHRLLDPRIAPSAALPWLAGFVGLALDPVWPEAAQRRLIAAAARLFRIRGTLASLQEMLELLTDSPVQVVESFRLRGGGVVGNPQAQASQAVLGAGYRVGGMIGVAQQEALADLPAIDFDRFAHHFTVIVVAHLSDEQLGGVNRLIEQHKPAHTAFSLCTVETGLRAGLGANVGLSTVVGRSGGFDKALVGDLALGAGFVLGRPALGDEEAAS